MKKSIYLNFSVMPTEDEHQAYVQIRFEQMQLAIFDLRSIQFVDALPAWFGTSCCQFVFYIPQRGDDFTLYGVSLCNNMVELDCDMKDVIRTFFKRIEDSYDFSMDIPDFVRFLLTLMSDKQVRDNFPKLYPLYHGYHAQHFTL